MRGTPSKENERFNGVDRSPLSRGTLRTPDRRAVKGGRSDSIMGTPPASRTASRARDGPATPKFADLAAAGERVRTIVRVRPTFEEGETPGAVEIDEASTGLLIKRGIREDGTLASTPESTFEFDQVLGPSATQQDVYRHAVQGIVNDVLDGYNGTVMAYGQTGAGKTFTLSNIQPDAIGMMPRAAADIFYKTRSDPVHDYIVFMSYIQIYMEQIQDLINPESENLQLRESPEGGVYVAGVKEVEVKSMEECLHLLSLGDRNRTVAFTNMNAHSSRSHAIVMLTVVKRKRTPPSEVGSPSAETAQLSSQQQAAAANSAAAAGGQTVKVGKLFIVDLAGSERLKKSGSTGLRANEAKSINLSLTCLGMCINARSDKNATHVPFRASKLTRLLQESLGGNAKTSLVVAIADAQEHAEESVQSMLFGSRAMRVCTNAKVNEAMDYKVLHAELLAQLDMRDADYYATKATSEEVASLRGVLEEQKQKNAQILDNLKSEAEAEKERLEQAMAAMREEQQQEKAVLEQALQQTRGEREERDRLLQMHEGDLAASREKNRQLSEALTQAQQSLEQVSAETAARAAEVHRLQEELRQLQANHEQAVKMSVFEMDQLKKSAELNAEVAATKHTLAVEELGAQLQRAKDETRSLQERLAQQEASTKAEVSKRNHAISSLEKDLTESQLQSKHLTGKLMQVEERASQLEVAGATLHSQVAELQGVRGQLESSLGSAQEEISRAARARREFLQVWQDNRRRHGAARVIQRQWRVYANHKYRNLNAQNVLALNATRTQLGNLELQKGDLERKQAANLAWLGRLMVANSCTMMGETAEGLLNMFILPQKDRKAISGLSQRLQLGRLGKKNTRTGSFFSQMSIDSPPGSTDHSPSSTPRASDIYNHHHHLEPVQHQPSKLGPLGQSPQR